MHLNSKTVLPILVPPGVSRGTRSEGNKPEREPTVRRLSDSTSADNTNLLRLPKSPINLRQDEFVIWSGKPDYHPRRILLTIVGIGLLSLMIAVLGLRGIRNAEDVQLIPAVLLIVNLSIFFGYHGTSYYITSRRIIRQRDLLLLERRREIRLETLSDVMVKRRSRRGFLKFRTSAGGTLNFSMLREDPDNIRQIAIDAKSRSEVNSPA
jgi:hypothetical protein